MTATWAAACAASTGITLRAPALGARDGKIVLGEMQNQNSPVLPSPGQRAAVGFGRNIRPLNVYSDPDGVIRRLPLTFTVDGKPVPSMAAELATRASGAAPSAKIAKAGAVPGTVTLNFAAGADDIPTFSLADLSTPAPTRTTRISPAAISTARSCCLARCWTWRIARLPRHA